MRRQESQGPEAEPTPPTGEEAISPATERGEADPEAVSSAVESESASGNGGTAVSESASGNGGTAASESASEDGGTAASTTGSESASGDDETAASGSASGEEDTPAHDETEVETPDSSSDTAPEVELGLYQVSVRVKGRNDDDLDDVEASARDLVEHLVTQAEKLEDEPDGRGLG
jgi:hypothetical protein